MSTTEIPASAGSYVSPGFENARVSDAMRHGVLTCPPDTPLATVARMMASHHVHSVVVTTAEAERDADSDEAAWGLLTDRELLRAADHATDVSAGEAATTDFVHVGPDEPLGQAARRMLDAGATHAAVMSSTSRRPVGMISTLDIAGVIAWGRG